MAGANGLGKSTLIAALNFALTGIVPEPGKSFSSAEEYYRYNKAFAQKFFAGRVSERDRKTAEISIDFMLGAKSYHLVRGVFEPNTLRELTILDPTANKENSVFNGSDLTPKSRLEMFQAKLTAHTGLDSFEQFVFLQSYILTFDERRHLLFWDDKVLGQVLYIAFGVSPQVAQDAEDLRRDMEKAGSLARNANWQATDLRNKITELEEALALSRQISGDSSVETEAHYKALTAQQQECADKAEKLDAALSDSTVRISDFSAQLASLRSDYESEYSRRLKGRIDPEHHPLVESSIATGQCGVCGAKTDLAMTSLREKIKARICPLCSSPVKTLEVDKSLRELQQLDKKITEANLRLRESFDEKKRLTEEREAIEARMNSVSRTLAKFENENKAFLQSLRLKSSGSSELDGALSRYRSEMERHLERKRSQYERRNKKREALALLQKRLIKGYADAEEQFVPSFKQLAEHFLGLDLNIRLVESRGASGVTMVVEVNKTPRREVYQLSESQRFFLDIALRMALIQHMADTGSKGCLLVDTPEGALDIAYESRAGNMFAEFVEAGFQLLMTANINSSHLLLSLAERCGTSKMKICRMTKWGELSKVQEDEENLFEDAYKAIEKALRRKTVKRRSSRILHA